MTERKPHCTARGGSGIQSHCDHQLGQAHYSEPKTFQCCYCGRIRVENPLPATGGAYTLRPEEHGPFAPQTRIMY